MNYLEILSPWLSAGAFIMVFILTLLLWSQGRDLKRLKQTLNRFILQTEQEGINSEKRTLQKSPKILTDSQTPQQDEAPKSTASLAKPELPSLRTRTKSHSGPTRLPID
jgi:hypothetical protein